MRRIDLASTFKRDYKRESKGRHKAALASDFLNVVQLLAKDEPLPARYHDHALTGEWAEHRDCHIKPDLVLIYRKFGAERLRLIRLGSHSELGL